MQDFDFAIIGAGIAGVTAAYHLAPQLASGAKVVVLEREHVPAYHTTGRSAALHSETYGNASIRAISALNASSCSPASLRPVGSFRLIALTGLLLM